MASHPTGQGVVEAIGQAATGVGLAAGITRTDHHVVAFLQLCKQKFNEVRVVLTIGIHEDDDLAGGCPRAAFDRGTVAHGVGAVQHGGAMPFGNQSTAVAGTVVDHDDLGIGI